jgi:hypothetical protein
VGRRGQSRQDLFQGRRPDLGRSPGAADPRRQTLGDALALINSYGFHD